LKTNPNVSVLKEAFETWNASKGRSIEHWLNIMTDDVRFRSLGEGGPGLEFTCGRSSKAEVAEYLQGLTTQLEMIHYTVEEYIDAGDKVIAISRTAWKNKTTGRDFETLKVDIARFRDGKIHDFLETYDTSMLLEVANFDMRAIVEGAYASRRHNDVEEVVPYFHPKATFRIVASADLGELSQTFTGHDALRGAFEQFFKIWDWQQFPIKDMIIDGNKATVHSCGTMRHTPSDTEFPYEILDIVTVEDGKIIEFVEFLDTHQLKQFVDIDVS